MIANTFFALHVEHMAWWQIKRGGLQFYPHLICLARLHPFFDRSVLNKARYTPGCVEFRRN